MLQQHRTHAPRGRSVSRMSSHIRCDFFDHTSCGWQLWFCDAVNKTFLKPFRVPSRTFPICRTPLIRISILSKGDLCVVALPNCGSKWMTTVLVQFSGIKPDVSQFWFRVVLHWLSHTLISHDYHVSHVQPPSNQSVELRDVVAPIVSSDASELANTVSSLLSLHS